MLFNMVADSLFMPAKLSIFREISHGNETFSRNLLQVSEIYNYLCSIDNRKDYLISKITVPCT